MRTTVDVTVVLPDQVVPVGEAVHEYGDPVSENRQDGANWNRDDAHRPNVNPQRYAECGRARGCNRTAEPGDDANRNQKSWRTDRTSFHPRRQAIEIGMHIEQL